MLAVTALIGWSSWFVMRLDYGAIADQFIPENPPAKVEKGVRE